MTSFLSELRQMVRSLRRAPVYTFGVLLTLGLGIGLNTVGFSVVHGILLRPFDLPHSDRLVMVWQDMRARDGDQRSWTGRGLFSDWRSRSRSFEGMSALITFPADLTEGELPEQVPGAVVSHEFFSVLGVQPELGRSFRQEEEDGAQKVVILSHGLWQRRFGGDQDVLGRKLTVNGDQYLVIGVLPEGFSAPLAPSTQLWSVLPLVPVPDDRGYSYLRVIGRLSPQVSIDAAQAEMNHVTENLAQEYPEALHDVGVTVQPLIDAVVGPSRRLLLVLFGSGLLVLLAICINVASLTLARTATRRQDFAVREALGAGRRRLGFRLIVECLILALCGAVLGVVLGRSVLGLLRATAPAQLPRFSSVRVDGTVFVFALLVSLGAGLLAGIIPALTVWRSRLSHRLVSPVADGGSGGSQRLRSGLVIVEIALGLVLMISGGLLLQTLHNLSTLDVGFERQSVVVGHMSLPPARFPELSDRVRFVSDLEGELDVRPEIASAGMVSSAPLFDGVGEYEFVLDGVSSAEPEEDKAYYRVASPGFFRTLEIPLRAGRFFESNDREQAPPVAMVNERFVARFLNGRNPLGQRLRIEEVDQESDPWRTIVGVVGNFRGRALDQPSVAEIYVPIAQEPGLSITVVARASGPTPPVYQVIQKEAARLRPDQVVASLTTMDDVMSEALAPRRFAAILMTVFTVIVLFLVIFGIYSVVALSMTQRRREMAIRVAVGASVGRLIGRIMWWSASLVAAGVVAGLGLAFTTRTALASLLYGVASLDWRISLLMALVLAAIALCASFVPAMRAVRIDPADTLRDLGA